jgi:hypothetical protein
LELNRLELNANHLRWIVTPFFAGTKTNDFVGSKFRDFSPVFAAGSVLRDVLLSNYIPVVCLAQYCLYAI